MKRLRIKRRARHLAENETGGTLAELAILIPFLIVMVAAVAELGRYFQTYSTLSKATRASARYLSRVAYEGESTDRLAQNVAVCGKTDCTGLNPAASGLTTANVLVSTEAAPGGEGNPITVTVSIRNYTFQPLFNLGALLGNNTFSLALPIRPSTTMYYMWTEPAGGEEGG
jgi:Flp pilus assembly protein TadG